MDNKNTQMNDENIQNQLSDENKAGVTGLEFEIDEGTTEFIFLDDNTEESSAGSDEPKAETEEGTDDTSIAKRESDAIDQAYNSQFFPVDNGRLNTMYVPRFTEASENYRRRTGEVASDPDTVVNHGKSSDFSSRGGIDPTAELDDNASVKHTVVTPTENIKSEMVDENITLFKFSKDMIKPKAPAEEIHGAELIDVLENDDEVILIDSLENDEEAVPAVAVEMIADKTAEPEVNESAITEEEKKTEIADPAQMSDKPENENTEKTAAYQNSSYTHNKYIGNDEHNEDGPQTEFNGKNKKFKAEFTNLLQRDELKDKFLDSIVSARIRLVVSIALLVLLSIVNIARIAGRDILASIGIGSIPYIHEVLDLQFAVCFLLLALPEIIHAASCLAKKIIVPEITLLVSPVLIVGYTLCVTFSANVGYSTFGVLVGIQTLSAILASYIKINYQYLSFKIVSKNMVKSIMDKRLTRTLPNENMALDGAVDEYSSNTARLFRAAFVDDFFARTAKNREDSKNNTIILGCSLGIALVVGLIRFLTVGYSLVHGIEAFVFVYLLAFPCFSILSHKLPCKHSFMEAFNSNSAFVGEDSIYDTADVDVICFEDTEIFGIEDVSVKKIYLYGNPSNTAKALSHMYSIFSVVGGPLDHLFTYALDRKCPQATDIIIENDGVSGLFDGQRIHAGTEEYMKRHHIRIPSDDYKTKTSGIDSTKALYGAEGTEVYVKFLIRYSFTEEFTMILPTLKENKIVPLIYTRDPNINADLVRGLTSGEDLIRVLKKSVPKAREKKVYRRAHAGVVTAGEDMNPINMVLLAKRYTKMQSILSLAELISVGCGALIGVLFCMGSISVIPAVYLGLWHLATMCALYVYSRKTFSIGDLEREE